MNKIKIEITLKNGSTITFEMDDFVFAEFKGKLDYVKRNGLLPNLVANDNTGVLIDPNDISSVTWGPTGSDTDPDDYYAEILIAAENHIQTKRGFNLDQVDACRNGFLAGARWANRK